MVQSSDAACPFSKSLQQEGTSTEDKLRSIMNFPQLKLLPKTEFPQHHMWMPIKILRQKRRVDKKSLTCFLRLCYYFGLSHTDFLQFGIY